MELIVELELDLPEERTATLAVTTLVGEEAIGQPYRFTLTAVQPGSELPLEPDEVMSIAATIRFLESKSGVQSVVRTVRGVVQRFEDRLEPDASGGFPYTFVVAPRFAELDRFVSQDLYAGLSYPEVIRAKLTAAQWATTDFELRLLDPNLYGATEWTDADPDTTTVQPRLVIQYRESDRAFISRLAEHVGISYFFEDDGEVEKLVFTDHSAGFPCAENPISFQGGSNCHGILEMSRRTQAIASDYYTYDYSYRTPAASFEVGGEKLFDILGGESHLTIPSAGAHVEYAPNAKNAAEAALLAKVRAESAESERQVFDAQGPLPTWFAGMRFKIEGHARLDSDSIFLAVAVEHRYSNPKAFMTTERRPAEYKTFVKLIYAEKTGIGTGTIGYRPPRRTPRPRINGVVTGVIQGASPTSELQDIDFQGRYTVKLQFDQSTRVMPRVRMAQPHSGANYGHHFPIRAGAEVLVAFLDGDPDRPVIIGTVPNPLKKSPVVSPMPNEVVESIELSRIRTRSGIMIEISDGPKADGSTTA